MVESANVDVTISTIAALIAPPTPPQPRGIDQKALEQILTRPLAIGQTSDGMFIGSQRDQIEVVVGGNKVNARDLSGRKTFSESKIPHVLHFFIESSQITSYGINFTLTVQRVEPIQWIRDSILSSQISEKTQKTLIGGAGTIKIVSGQKTWSIKFEPGDGNIINLDFNASETTMQLPDEDKLKEELQEQYNALIEFLSKLEL